MSLSPRPLTFGAFERTLSAVGAVRLAKEKAKELKLNVYVQQTGKTIKTSYCELVNEAGRKSTGFGKGLAEQSLASAIFEAFEHLYSIFADSPNDLKLQPLDLAHADSCLVDASPDFATICGANSVEFSRIPFSRIDSPNETIDFPFFLTNPYFKPASQVENDALNSFSLKRYSTNSGTAAGIGLSEAILHGLLEVIERDAIGIELLRTVIHRSPYAVREIQIEELPLEIQEFCALVESDTEGKLSLWNITTEFHIPVVLAALSVGGEKGSRYFGSGASLSVDYAMERAILETVQYFHVHEMNGKARPCSGHQDVREMPVYIRCFLEGGFFGFRGGTTYADLTTVKQPIEALSPDQQISLIVDVLRKNNIKAYWRPVTNSQIAIAQVVVPSLERFHLVSRGVPVAPSSRGRKALSIG